MTVKLSTISRVNPVNHMNDAALARLISECIAGNQDAIATFVRQYETGIFRLALSIVEDQAEASEITQETLIAALGALPRYREQQSIKAWLYRIALNQGRAHLRKRNAIERLKGTLTSLFRVQTQKQVSPEEELVEDEREAAVWRALNRLDERHRLVVVLRYFHELPIAEISQILSIHEGTVHSRLHSAREKLRNELRSLRGT
jgi:RNA polymerase sigma-70 factor (ECF subfamily)